MIAGICPACTDGCPAAIIAFQWQFEVFAVEQMATVTTSLHNLVDGIHERDTELVKLEELCIRTRTLALNSQARYSRNNVQREMFSAWRQVRPPPPL